MPGIPSHPTALQQAGHRHQSLVFTYHRSGTVLFDHVMERVAAAFGLRTATCFGLVTRLESEADIVMIAHSLLGCEPTRPYRGVRIIRDPRDIWVSSYLYHRHGPELWCRNTDLRQTGPIGYPQVPFSVVHRPEPWKRTWIERLDGRSYQQNLNDRTRPDGLAFELAGYTGATLDAMRAWQARPGVLDVRLEDISAHYDGQMEAIFHHLGFDAPQITQAVALAAKEDVGRMSDETVAASHHIHSRQLSKWQRVLSPPQVAAFEAAHGDLIEALGYALSPRTKPAT